MNWRVMALCAVLAGAVLFLWSRLDAAQVDVARLTTERDNLSMQLDRQKNQGRTEQSIGQNGQTSSQQGNAEQEKTRIEIREKIIHEPGANQFVPDDVAGRVWQLTRRARIVVLPADASQPDRLPGPTTSGR